MIAHKRYAFLDRNQPYYNIDYETNTLYKFCNKYRILYKKGKFLNREKLRFDIEEYNNILLTQFLGKGTKLGWLKMWFVEKWWKLF